MNAEPQLTRAQLELGCSELDADLAFFTATLGFRIERIFPADDPAVVELSGYGLALRLRRGNADTAVRLRLLCDDPAAALRAARRRDPAAPVEGDELVAPGGTRVAFVDADPPLTLPPLRPSFLLTRFGADGAARWQRGRAGMLYRDLIPGRLGGRYIASHIRIDNGGPVPDYVHYHKIRFQMIYCYRGWVRLVYEDQGPPFVMGAGDGVLQPPGIRHRVLESSPGLEVIEIGCPAEHPTLAEHGFDLPTGVYRPQRDFGGQRFALHRADGADRQRWRGSGWRARDFGFAAATGGIAGARVVTADGAPDGIAGRASGEFTFWFVLGGRLTLAHDGRGAETLDAGDCCVLPDGSGYRLRRYGAVQLLEVVSPAV